MNTWITRHKRFLFDTGERAGWTFVQAFIAIWLIPVVADILGGSGTVSSAWAHLADTSVLDKAAVGGLAAVISFGKSVGLARYIGSPTTAATLPYSDDTPRA